MMKIENNDKIFVYTPDKGLNKHSIDESALLPNFDNMKQVIKYSKCSKISLNYAQNVV